MRVQDVESGGGGSAPGRCRSVLCAWFAGAAKLMLAWPLNLLHSCVHCCQRSNGNDIQCSSGPVVVHSSRCWTLWSSDTVPYMCQKLHLHSNCCQARQCCSNMACMLADQAICNRHNTQHAVMLGPSMTEAMYIHATARHGTTLCAARPITQRPPELELPLRPGSSACRQPRVKEQQQQQQQAVPCGLSRRAERPTDNGPCSALRLRCPWQPRRPT